LLRFVVPVPANVRRHFLPWDRPLLAQAVSYLVGNWSGKGPLDLSTLLVVVPTRQAGRRLREALAAHAAEHGAAVFPPRVTMPELLVAPPASEDIASPTHSLLAWTEVFRTLELAAFRNVFPVDPPARTFSWALRLAHEFTRLQRSLAEAELSLADVVTRVGENFPERERWRQIGELEALHQVQLREAGFRDMSTVRREHVRAPQIPEGTSRIVVIAAPDPVAPALTVLGAFARDVPVDVLVFAPESEQASFDGWGRPMDTAWSTRSLDFQDFEERVHLCADPAAQASKVRDVAKSYLAHPSTFGVGVGDPEVLPTLDNALAHAGIAAFNPEGRRRQGDGLYQLLVALAALARDESFGVVETLARCPDFLGYVGSRAPETFSAAVFLRELDSLHTRYLPPTLAEARRHAPNSSGLAAVAELRALLRSGTFSESAVAALGAVFRDRQFNLQNSVDDRMAEAAGVWMDVLREIARLETKFDAVTSADWWEFALRVYGETVHYDEKPAGALELQGWLELLWEDAPHLIVAGLNDGRVPDAIVGDPYLPESLRVLLGLKTNAARFARDAYVLQALAASRRQDGRLDLLVGKNSSAGEPLRPSRLLLRCDDAELPQRVRFLFAAAESTRQSPGWQRAWKLTVPPVVPPNRVAVTAFRSWLDCPFRFYLSRVLRMESVDPAKTELDVLDFGTLCHAALEAMGLEPGLRDCTDANVIREFLLGQLEVHALKRFGRDLTLPLIVQLESARQRLSRAAETQAQTRAEGWVIESVERKFEIDVGGLLVVGKIDRIDRHDTTGAVRVLDYKTSDRPVDPWQAHLRGLRRDETAPEFARLVFNGRDYVWSDLQLPFYLRAVRGMEGISGAVESLVDCGYFNLPKAASETGIRPWDNYPRELDEAAWRCAEGVSLAIRSGQFWPPNEAIRPERDDFASLFHHGVEASVDWKGVPL
jgi:ATP-dependent helicase/nuclease subunit B